MDPDLVYVKTPSGEEAMQQRTRVMQRNVRMILILVDGQSTFADLCLKTGNTQLTENALRELERGGFVEHRGEQDSLWAESKKVAQEIRAAAIDKVIQFSSPRAKATAKKQEPELPTSEGRVFVDSMFQIPLRSDSSLSQFSLPPMPFGQIPEETKTAVFSEQGSKKPNKRLANSKPSKPSVIERLKARRSAKRIVSIKPIRRGQRRSMSLSVAIMLWLVGVLVFAVLAVSLFPYNSYLPDVEAAVAKATGRPVTVGSMQVSIYPNPGLRLSDVRIGTDREELRIAELRLVPRIGTVTASKKIILEVVVSGANLSAERISGLSTIFLALAQPAAAVGVERMRFEKTELAVDGLGFSGLEGEGKLNTEGQFQSLSLRSSDRSLSLEATPSAQGLALTLTGLGWRPFQGSPFVFDSVNVTGILADRAFKISDLELRIFDGLVRGTAVLRADNKPSVFADIVFERINASRFGDALGVGQQFSGEAAGEVRLSTTADSWADLFSGIEAHGKFSVGRGSIRGIDLTEAVRRVSSAPVQGGATNFESLSGRIGLTPTIFRFTGLVLNSGLMQSTGFIEINKALNVSGRMELQMRGTVNQTRVPISISGPLGTPSVQAAKG